jgi:hypothetical protein
LTAAQSSNSHYETNFGVSSACDAVNTNIGFLKARRRRAFKKPIFIMRIAELKALKLRDSSIYALAIFKIGRLKVS